MNFLIRILVIAAVSFGLAQVLNGIHVADFWTAFIFAIVLALLNMFIRPFFNIVYVAGYFSYTRAFSLCY